MKKPLSVASLSLLAACTASSQLTESKHAITHPATPAKEVKDTYHGVEVVEQYRWLEDWNDPEVKKWSDVQNTHARSFLDQLPGRELLKKRLTEVIAAPVISHGKVHVAAGKLFALRRHPPKQQSFLVVMPSADEPHEAKILVDPTLLDPKALTSIDFYQPSPDGKLVAVSLSSAGTEAGDVHIYDVATGKEVDQVIPRVNGGTAGGHVAWAPDSSGFYYTRYPRGDERSEEDHAFYVQVYFHKLGTPTEKDTYELGKDAPRVAEWELAVHPSGAVLATLQNGDGGEFAHYLRGTGGAWKQLTKFEDRIVQITFGDRDLYLISRKDAPKGKLLRMPIGAPDAAKAEVVVPEGEDTLVSSFWGAPTVVETKEGLLLTYQLGGPSVIRAFDRSGKPAIAPRQLDVASITGMIEQEDGTVLFSSASYVTPNGWFRFDPKSGETTRTAISTDSPIDLSKVKVVREMAVSKDGTKIPVNILIPAGAKMDGSDPAIVTGYGGYGVSLQPSFQAVSSVILEQGVILAIANLRGGGEFGEQWHLEGNLTKKQNVFDDFVGVLQHLVARKYTSPEKLAIYGGSNGGLLMGAVMTQRPDLVKAVVSSVGIYDMLRVELSPNGAFNVTEFGTVQNPEHFKAMYAYSPYHRVTEGTKYPATLFMTGANDPRVDPMQSRKMTARLQAANASDTPILLRTENEAGHGATNIDQAIANLVDMYSFLLAQLSVEVRAQEKTVQ